jgi:exonuclease SbcD
MDCTMRILHTADWHLGDRLGRIDRTAHLRRAVGRVAEYCALHQVDVLLIAGDLFSELSRPDSLRSSIEHLQETFQPFLLGGGTILALTGNHDNENFCQTLRLIMTLAAPAVDRTGDTCPPGRLYLATNPTFVRLADRQGQEVQFVLMPYPTPTRYLREEEVQRYASLEEKNRHLQAAYTRELRTVLERPDFQPDKPTVLAAHIHVQGSTLPTLFRMSEEESIIFSENDLPAGMSYVALGHIHQHQCLRGLPHVRYSGSIERLDLGEQRDQKGVVLVDLGPDGLRSEPQFLPIEATPIYSIDVHTPLLAAIHQLKEQYPDAAHALVRIHFTYTAGQDVLEQALHELEQLFPSWYYRDWVEAGALDGTLVLGGANPAKSFEDTVRDYLRQELLNHVETDREAVLARAEALMNEVQE